MKSRLKEIEQYLLEHGWSEEDINESKKSTIETAYIIALYAHRDQKRLLNEQYVTHPLSLINIYQNFIGKKEKVEINQDAIRCLEESYIPFYGVQEVCLLHDVVEDTDFTFEDVKAVYVELGYEEFYEKFISLPLKLITHDKSVDYGTYIKEVCRSPISAMVKMCDLQDNLNIFTLDTLDSYNYDRCHRYIKYMKRINDEYSFLENIHHYYYIYVYENLK